MNVYECLWWFMMVDDDSGLFWLVLVDVGQFGKGMNTQCRLQVPFTGTSSLSRSVATYSCTSEASSINQWPCLSLVFQHHELGQEWSKPVPTEGSGPSPRAPSPGLSAPHQTVCHPTDPSSPGAGIRNGTWLVGKSSIYRWPSQWNPSQIPLKPH